jgi:hypothetical protein
MYSAKGHPTSLGWGCPIRTSPDHSLLATPRGFSQPSTSFIGSWCQGIHRAPLLARRLDLSNSPSRQDQRSQKKPCFHSLCSTRLGSKQQPVSVCSTTLRFFRYTTSALASASRGTSTNPTFSGWSRRHDWLCNSFLFFSRLLGRARGHKNGPTLSSRCGIHKNSAANPMRLATPTI